MEEMNKKNIEKRSAREYRPFSYPSDKRPYKVCRTSSSVKVEKDLENKLKKTSFNKKVKIIAGIGTIIIFSTSLLLIGFAISDNNKEKLETATTTSEYVIEETEELENIIEVGTRSGIEYIEKFLESDEFLIFKKYGEFYGVDPYILVAMGFQESGLNHESHLPGGSAYNGYAVGVMQHESPSGDIVSAYNYVTGEIDSVACSKENVYNKEKNIQLAFMILSNRIKNYNGNIYMAIQSYNFGSGMMSAVLNKMANNTGKSVEDLKLDFTNLDWIEYAKDAHENPSKYISTINWNSYGDGEYLQHVMGYVISKNVNYMYNGELQNFDLEKGVNCENNSIIM